MKKSIAISAALLASLCGPAAGCDLNAAETVQDNLSHLAKVTTGDDGSVKYVWAPGWDAITGEQRWRLIDAAVSADFCLTGERTREIRFYSNGRMVGHANRAGVYLTE